ncbi:hypothetical protein HRI_003050600 [Hibiscus trionum]|uniref:OVATE domain-containing protein n=1 Tax=Hibiscus trionum TaxID=183268 RepID=A0A9W7MA23_HIBTR|nr:hypothetical protein HRI_003050600 [Hibiscus trionum]
MLLTESIRKTENLFHEARKAPKISILHRLFYQPRSGLEEAMMRKNGAMVMKEILREEDECSGSFMSFEYKSPEKITKQNGGKEEKTEEGCYALVKKMKELEMMDVGDMEHVLDVEEAIHYYSRLRSPVYLSIVNKFFTEMYSEFSVPQASARIDGSKRRFGSFRM